MPRLPPIRRNPKTGLLPKGLKRRPSNKTWRKGHHLRSGKWVPGIWVFRAGKARRPKPFAKPKPKKARKVPRPPTPTRATPRAPVSPGLERVKGRKFSGKIFRWVRTHGRKGQAQTHAQTLRKEGLRTRVVKERFNGGWGVYRTGKAAPRVIPPVQPGPRPSVRPRAQVARKPWSSERKRRARLVAGRTGAPVVQADALIRRAKSKGVAYDTVDWDRLQGKDLTFAGRVRRLTKMVGRTPTKSEEARMLAADRAEFQEQRRRRRPPPGREEAARLTIAEELRQRAEHLERVLFQI